MSRYIDADALITEMERCSYETWSKGVNPTWWAQAVKVKDNIVKCIERQPTADVVEVVRCKDCRFWKEYSVENADTHIPLEELWGVKLPIKSLGIGICECEKFYGDYKDERLKLYRALNPLETTKDDYCSCGIRRAENEG